MPDKIKGKVDFLINVFYIAVIAGIVFVLYKYVFGLLLPFILAFCIVSSIHPIIKKITAWLKISQKIIAVMVMAIIYTLVGMGIFWSIFQLIIIIKDLLVLLPDFYSDTLAPSIVSIGEAISEFLQGIPGEYVAYLDGFQESILNAAKSSIVGLSEKGIDFISGFSNKVPTFIIGLVFTIMLSFFISMQYDEVLKFIKKQMSAKSRSIMTDLKVIFIDTILNYLKAYMILMFITFIELSIGLLIIKVDNSVGIAMGIAVFDALPFFGTGAIMIPWIILEIIHGQYTLAIGLAIVYGVITFIRNIIEPKVVGDQLGMNPIVSLVVIYIGFKVFGVLGMIFMPILTQIILALHKKGSIRLYK